MPRKHQLRDRVFNILRDYPETRNCDARLVAMYWKRYCPAYITNFDPHGALFSKPSRDYFLSLADLGKVQSASSIERMRRHIQNKMHRFPPTDRAVAKKRRMNMEKWEKDMAALTPDSL